MKINTETWHYKLWRKSFNHGDYIPHETDLCRYCHKVFWQVVSYAALASILLAGVVILLVAAWQLLTKAIIPYPLITFGVVASAATFITLIVLYNRWLNRGRSYRQPQTLVGKYARATKQKVCPLVEFTEDSIDSFVDDED